MGSIRTGRLIHLDEHRRAELNDVGRAEHDRYVVTETHDGTLVLSPAPGWTDDDAALLARPDILELIQQDPSQLVEAPIDTTAESAATDLACLALHQARLSGRRIRPTHQGLPPPLRGSRRRRNRSRRRGTAGIRDRQRHPQGPWKPPRPSDSPRLPPVWISSSLG